MSRYVEADGLIKRLESHRIPSAGLSQDYLNGVTDGIRAAVRIVEDAPTADVAPVVRCKECKFRAQFTDGHSECRLWPPVPMSYRTVTNDDYCSRGARMRTDK